MVHTNILELRKFVAPEFVFGIGARKLVVRYAVNLGTRKPLVVTDSGIRRVSWCSELLQALADEGFEPVLYEDVSPNPRDYQCMNGAELYREQECDAIIAIGGGSVMDCAKGIGIVSGNGGHILDYEGVDRIGRPTPPIICIPTTAGSSADVSQFAIITDTEGKRKIAIVSKMIIPDVALIDAETTTTMDPYLTACVGLDALTHAIEAYVSNANAPVTDLHALEAIRVIAAHLPQAVAEPGNLEARSWVMHGSMLAGLAFSNAILGAVHSMAHSLGGLMDLPHGHCNAILLEYVVGANYKAAPDRFDALGRNIGAQFAADAPFEERRDAVQAALRALREKVGLHGTLATLGVRREDLESLARTALADPCMVTNPVDFTLEEIVNIYEQAL